MNKMEEQIVKQSIEMFAKNTGIIAQWKVQNYKRKEFRSDGIFLFTIENKLFKFSGEIKKEVRVYQIDQINNYQQNNAKIIIAQRLSPEMRIELRRRDIAYIESNGNLYIKTDGLFLFVDGQPPIRTENETTNRAFTKTGLKVIFHLLLIDDLINKPYREIAAITEVGLGNINYIFTGLKEMGFLLQLTKDQYKLTNKKELLDRWLTGFTEKLKPGLNQGKFAFATETAQKNWREIKLQEDQTFWAGEPAGDLLTDHLRPEIFTIYTNEGPNDIIRNYKLIPKENGNVRIYQKFWNVPDADLKNIAPPLLVYADLITTTDKRCRETANIIYDKYIQPNL
jgi:hypothetical protein